MRTPESETPVAAMAPEPHSLRAALLLAAVLFITDALFLNLALVSLFVCVGVILVGIPKALTRVQRPERVRRLRNSAIYLAGAALAFAFIEVNAYVAHGRAEQLITSVEAFRARHARYPKTLEELVPDHIARVPRANYSPRFGRFNYAYAAEDPWLSYNSGSPFGMRVYSFARREWKLD